MALDTDALVVPGKGHFWLAPVGTGRPTAGTTPSAPWVEIGHTSNDSPLSIGREGGEVTTLPTWQSSAARTTISPLTYQLTYSLLQEDEQGLKLYYGGGSVSDGEFRVPTTPAPQEHALFLQIIDGGKTWERYFPKVSTIGSDAEEFDPENFLGKPVTSSVLDSDLSYLFSILLEPSEES